MNETNEGPSASRNDFVSKIVSDPKQPPETLLLEGFLGASSEDDHTRLYFDAQLSDYIDIPNDAILHTQDLPKESAPLGGSYVWIKKDAEILHGPMGAQRQKAKFLGGRIQQQHLPGAQWVGGAEQLHFGRTGNQPRCGLQAVPFPFPTAFPQPCAQPTNPEVCPPQTIPDPRCPLITEEGPQCAPTMPDPLCGPQTFGDRDVAP